jgi:hypothetical protein
MDNHADGAPVMNTWPRHHRQPRLRSKDHHATRCSPGTEGVSGPCARLCRVLTMYASGFFGVRHGTMKGPGLVWVHPRSDRRRYLVCLAATAGHQRALGPIQGCTDARKSPLLATGRNQSNRRLQSKGLQVSSVCPQVTDPDSIAAAEHPWRTGAWVPREPLPEDVGRGTSGAARGAGPRQPAGHRLPDLQPPAVRPEAGTQCLRSDRQREVAPRVLSAVHLKRRIADPYSTDCNAVAPDLVCTHTSDVTQPTVEEESKPFVPDRYGLAGSA